MMSANDQYRIITTTTSNGFATSTTSQSIYIPTETYSWRLDRSSPSSVPCMSCRAPISVPCLSHDRSRHLHWFHQERVYLHETGFLP